MKKDRVLLVVILIAACGFFYSNRFIQDDAYITFRYAAHFASGDGLVWYPGSKEYGYTGFLFTLLIGLLLKTGISAESASYMLSVLAALGTLIAVFYLSLRLTASRLVASISCIALITHMTFASYATGGMETSLQSFFILLAYYWFFRWYASPAYKSLLYMGGHRL